LYCCAPAGKKNRRFPFQDFKITVLKLNMKNCALPRAMDVNICFLNVTQASDQLSSSGFVVKVDHHGSFA